MLSGTDRRRSRFASRLAIAITVLLPLATLAGCGPTISMPDLVGMRLDAGHRVLEEMGVENFEDTDVIGQEDSILRDANWVIVAQDPAPGTAQVDTDSKIKLSVGNEDDKSVLDRIPDTSPFAQEVADKAAEDAKDKQDKITAEEDKQQAAAKKTAQDSGAYARKIDDAVGETMQGLVALYVENADRVQAEGGGPVVAAQNAIAARDAFDQVLTVLSTRDVAPPDSLNKVKRLNGVEDRLRDATAGFVVASEELIKAIDTQAPSAFARELSARADAIRDWNAAIEDIYESGGLKPRLIPSN